jgi:hypothetical protein
MITTVSNCKQFRGLDVNNKDDDAELERIIGVVQAWLEKECNRKFDDSGPTPIVEYYSGNEWRTALIVGRPPIIAIQDVQIDNQRVWDKPVLDPAFYDVYDAEAGIIKFINYTLPRGTLNIRLRYRGGYSVIPADLEQAAIEMVWAVRAKGENNLIGVRSRTVADGSVQYLNLDLGSSNLAAIIEKYSLRTPIL